MDIFELELLPLADNDMELVELFDSDQFEAELAQFAKQLEQDWQTMISVRLLEK